MPPKNSFAAKCGFNMTIDISSIFSVGNFLVILSVNVIGIIIYFGFERCFYV